VPIIFCALVAFCAFALCIEQTPKEYKTEFDEIVNLISKLPDQQRLSIINIISGS
jgi:hypothetical protein